MEDKPKTTHLKMLAQLRAGCDLVMHYTLVRWFFFNIYDTEKILVENFGDDPNMVCITLEKMK